MGYGYVELETKEEQQRVLSELPTVQVQNRACKTAVAFQEPALKAFSQAKAREAPLEHPKDESGADPASTEPSSQPVTQAQSEVQQ